MIYVYEDKIPDLRYWEYSKFRFFDNDGRNRKFSKIIKAFKKAWSDNLVCSSFLVEFKGEKYVTFEAEYDEDFASVRGLSMDELFAKARDLAIQYSSKWPGFDVILGYKTQRWNNGDADHQVIVMMPYDVQVNDYNDVGHFMSETCYC